MKLTAVFNKVTEDAMGVRTAWLEMSDGGLMRVDIDSSDDAATIEQKCRDAMEHFIKAQSWKEVSVGVEGKKFTVEVDVSDYDNFPMMARKRQK